MTELFNPEQAPLSDQPLQSYREQLVGDGKKFKDDEALARGKWEGDKHITQLEAELKTLRDELQKRLTVEELAEKITSQAQHQPDNQPASQFRDRETPPTGQDISRDEILNLVKNTINQERTIDQARRNVDTVRQTLKNEWGPDFHVKLQQIAKDLDISQDFLGSLAETNPQGFLKVVRSAIPQRTVDANAYIPPRTSTSPLAGPKPNSWEYYEDMRKKDPARYKSVEVQRELHRNAIDAYSQGVEYIPG